MAYDQLVSPAFKLEFQAEMALAIQQNESKLKPTVRHKPCDGEASAASDLVNALQYRRRTGTNRSNFENPASFTRRWLMLRDPIESGQYLDTENKYRQMGDHSSELMQAHAASVNRGIDDIILGLDENGAITDGGLLGSVVEGKRPGASPVALPSEYQTVHGGTGLTIAKLRAARKKLAKDDNDLDRLELYMAVDPEQMDDLLGIVEGASANLNMMDQPQLKDGKVTRLMRFNFIEINRLPIVSSVRYCPAWTKNNVVLGIWQDIKSDLYNDTHAGNTPYMRVDAVMDCTRAQDKAVHIIQCTE